MPSARLGSSGKRAAQPKIARRAHDIAAPDRFGQADGGRIARPGERLAQRDPPAIDAVVVGRGPAVDRDRRVVDHAVGGPAGAQGGEIDEQFERRSGLAPRLGRAVEGRFGVASAADHRHHLAIGPHRHQRRLGIADLRARDGADRDPLQPPVERGLDLDLAEIGLERLLRDGRDPVGEIGAGGNRAAACARRAPALALRASRSLTAPVSAIAFSTSLLRFCAAARCEVGASRDGAWTSPASIADWARFSFSGSRSK